MGRVSEISDIYRTKNEMVEDVAFILSCGNLTFGTKFSVVDHVIWVWSEFDGKYEGCKYWSKNAVLSGSARVGLIHEHVVPRKIIRQKLFDLKKPSATSVKRILNKFCVGVVITKQEDDRLRELKLQKSMPDGWDGNDIWVRYKAAEIKVETINK